MPLVQQVTPIAAEAETVIANLKSWMAPTKVETPIILLPGSNEVHHESYGVILVIAPYNYPLQVSWCGSPHRLPSEGPPHRPIQERFPNAIARRREG